MLQDTLDPLELEQLMAAQHRPGFVLRILSELVWSADLLEGQAMRMDEALTYFGEQVGTCERCAHTMNPITASA